MWLFALIASLGLVAQIEPQPQRPEPEKPKVEKHVPVLTRAPTLVTRVNPVYPPSAVEDRVSGDVVLVLTLDATGHVSEVTVRSAPDPRLAAAAVAAGKQLVFTPAEVDGKPAPIQLTYKFTFEPPPPPPKAEPKEAAAPLPVTLEGRILVRGRRSPIEGAIVKAGGLGVQTGPDGRFALRLKPGTYEVTAKAPGYFDYKATETIAVGKEVKVTYYLLGRDYSPFETVVRATKEKRDATVIDLSRQELTHVPGTFGDPLRVLENLPGMNRAPFIGGQLLVRGANPGDTGTYFDGVQLPLLYHFGGLTSVVNPEFIDSIEFKPGGFGARHGRAIAGIVDVKTRRLEDQPARGTAKVDLMDASVFYRHPLGKHLSIAVAARRSYIDAILPSLLSLTGGNNRITVAPVYGDYQAKLDWDPTRDHKLSAFVFGSDDTFALLLPQQNRNRALSFDLHIGFHRLMLSDDWRINPELTLRSMPWAGITIQSAGGGEQGAGGVNFDFSFTRYEGGLREDLTWRHFKHLTLRAGLDLYFLRATAQATAPVGSDLFAFPSPIPEIPATQPLHITSGGSDLASYLEGTWEPGDGLKVTFGLRPELYVFGTHVRPLIDPRLAVRWTVVKGTTLKGAVGLYHQNPSLFAVNDLTGNPKLLPEAATQYVVGVEHSFSDVVDLDVQAFFNQRFHLAVSTGGGGVSGGKATSALYNNDGLGRAYGLEVLLRHKITRHLFGWIAYTLMKSEARSHPGDAFVPTRYDQTHILTVVASWKPGLGFEIGGRFRLVTGNPYTPVLFAVHDLDADNWDPVYGPTNSARLPTFRQLDLRVDHTWVFNTFTLDLFLDLLNATNTPNVEGYQYDYRYRQRIDFSLLPILPVIGVKGEW